MERVIERKKGWMVGGGEKEGESKKSWHEKGRDEVSGVSESCHGSLTEFVGG